MRKKNKVYLTLIRVIDNYKVAIRPVEFDDFSRILNMPKVNAGTIEYNSMMEYLTIPHRTKSNHHTKEKIPPFYGREQAL